MQTGKSLITSAIENGYYLCHDVDARKTVEIEVVSMTMTLFVRFSRNQASLWNMMSQQALQHFVFLSETQPVHIGGDCVERTYVVAGTPTGDFVTGDFVMINNLIDGETHAQMTMPVSERALDKFIKWEPSPAECSKFMFEEYRLALGETSQNSHYRSGGLVGQ